VGERATVRCGARFAFGSSGRPAAREGDETLPPDSGVDFGLYITALGTSEEVGALSGRERLEEGERKKVNGNDNFAYADYERAARCYGAALKAVDGMIGGDAGDGEGRADLDAVAKLMVDCGNNLAAAYIKLGQFAKAEGACVAVLSGDPANVKALYRAGTAAMEQTKYLEARLALDRLLGLDPESGPAKALGRELTKREKKYRAKEQLMMKQMGAKLFGGQSSVQKGRSSTGAEQFKDVSEREHPPMESVPNAAPQADELPEAPAPTREYTVASKPSASWAVAGAVALASIGALLLWRR